MLYIATIESINEAFITSPARNILDPLTSNMEIPIAFHRKYHNNKSKWPLFLYCIDTEENNFQNVQGAV